MLIFYVERWQLTLSEGDQAMKEALTEYLGTPGGSVLAALVAAALVHFLILNPLRALWKAWKGE